MLPVDTKLNSFKVLRNTLKVNCKNKVIIKVSQNKLVGIIGLLMDKTSD